MLRRRSDVDWSRWLEAVDLGYLVQRIDPDAWYPMETFERMGLAILTAIAQGDLDPCASSDAIDRLAASLTATSSRRATHATR